MRRIFFGWKMVAAAFSVAVFTWGIGFYGPPVFLNTIHYDRGWPIPLISAAITCKTRLSIDRDRGRRLHGGDGLVAGQPLFVLSPGDLGLIPGGGFPANTEPRPAPVPRYPIG
jgi:hypothetical protein